MQGEGSGGGTSGDGGDDDAADALVESFIEFCVCPEEFPGGAGARGGFLETGFECVEGEDEEVGCEGG